MKTVSWIPAIVALSLGCRDSAAPVSSKDIRPIAVSKLEAPVSASPATAFDVVLTVEVGGCVGFDHISEVRGGSQITLTAWGREFHPPTGGACLDYLKLEPHAYRLDPPFPSQENITIVVQPVQFGVLLTREVLIQ